MATSGAHHLKDSAELRLAELRAIHVRRRQLRMSDDDYRAMNLRVVGVESAGEMDARQRGAVLDELRRLGARSPRTTERHGQRSGEPQERLAAALWRELAELGVLKDPSEKGLRHFARRITGQDSLRWLSAADLNAVIEGLKGWRKRELAKRQAPPADEALPGGAPMSGGGDSSN